MVRECTGIVGSAVKADIGYVGDDHVAIDASRLQHMSVPQGNPLTYDVE